MLFKPFTKHIGLDISGPYFRVAAVHNRNGKDTLEGYAELSAPVGTIKNGVIIDEGKAIATIIKLLDALPNTLRSRYAHVSLAEQKTFIKLITLPEEKGTSVKDALNNIIVQHIPLPIDQIYLDWNTLPKSPDKPMQALVAVVEKDFADKTIQILSQANIMPLSLEIESLATTRSILINTSSKITEPTMIIDIGMERTTITVFDHGTVQFTSTTDFSDAIMIKDISEKANLTQAEAIKAKNIIGLDPRKGKGQVRKILLPLLHDLTESIDKAANYYSTVFNDGRDIAQVLLIGSGAGLIGLDEYIKQHVKHKVLFGDPLKFLAQNKITKQFENARKLGYSVAIGLALKELSID